MIVFKEILFSFLNMFRVVVLVVGFALSFFAFSSRNRVMLFVSIIFMYVL